VPAQQVDRSSRLMQQTGAKRLYLPSRMKSGRNEDGNGSRGVGEEYFPPSATTARRSTHHVERCPGRLQHTVVPARALEQLTSRLRKRGGRIVCTYFEENFLSLLPAEHAEGIYSCLDYYQTIGDPFSKRLLDRYDTLYPGSAKFTAGSACSGLYRGLQLWAAAVTEAGSLKQEAVIEALDHARIGAGGPAATVPGSHVRMNTYIACAERPSSSRTWGSSIRRNACWKPRRRTSALHRSLQPRRRRATTLP
jgi:branched-chain amino acid transport system substrate-binding protein